MADGKFCAECAKCQSTEDGIVIEEYFECPHMGIARPSDAACKDFFVRAENRKWGG